MSEYEFSDLARYNSETGRGIVHTPEWKAKMALEQQRFRRDLESQSWGGRVKAPKRRQLLPWLRGDS